MSIPGKNSSTPEANKPLPPQYQNSNPNSIPTPDQRINALANNNFNPASVQPQTSQIGGEVMHWTFDDDLDLQYLKCSLDDLSSFWDNMEDPDNEFVKEFSTSNSNNNSSVSQVQNSDSSPLEHGRIHTLATNNFSHNQPKNLTTFSKAQEATSNDDDATKLLALFDLLEESSANREKIKDALREKTKDTLREEIKFVCKHLFPNEYKQCTSQPRNRYDSSELVNILFDINNENYKKNFVQYFLKKNTILNIGIPIFINMLNMENYNKNAEALLNSCNIITGNYLIDDTNDAFNNLITWIKLKKINSEQANSFYKDQNPLINLVAVSQNPYYRNAIYTNYLHNPFFLPYTFQGAITNKKLLLDLAKLREDISQVEFKDVKILDYDYKKHYVFNLNDEEYQKLYTIIRLVLEKNKNEIFNRYLLLQRMNQAFLNLFIVKNKDSSITEYLQLFNSLDRYALPSRASIETLDIDNTAKLILLLRSAPLATFESQGKLKLCEFSKEAGMILRKLCPSPLTQPSVPQSRLPSIENNVTNSTIHEAQMNKAAQELWQSGLAPILKEKEGYLWNKLNQKGGEFKFTAEELPEEFFTCLLEWHNEKGQSSLPDITKIFNLLCGVQLTPDEQTKIEKVEDLHTLYQLFINARPAIAVPRLSPFLTKEISATLLRIKMREIAAALDNNSSCQVYFATTPCLLLAQDQAEAIVYLLSALFSADGILLGFNKEDDRAQTWLEGRISGGTRSEKYEQEPCVRLGAEQVTAIKEAVRESAPNKGDIILLQRQNAPKIVEIEPSSLIPLSNNQQNAESINKNLLDDQPVEEMDWEQPARKDEKKRKRSEKEGKPARSEKDEMVLSEEEEQTEKEKIKKNKYQKNYRYAELAHSYVPIGLSAPVVSNCNNNSEEGHLPILPAGRTLSLEEENFSHLPLWQQLTCESISSLQQSVERENIKRKAILDIRPLNYAIIDKLARQADKSPICFFNPRLKSYQKLAVAKILNSDEISPLLSFEMGLGKTYVLGELLLQRIARGANGHILVVAPKSLLTNHLNELQKIFCEAKQAIWHWKLQNLNDKTCTAFWIALNSALKGDNLQLIESLLPLFPLIEAKNRRVVETWLSMRHQLLFKDKLSRLSFLTPELKEELATDNCYINSAKLLQISQAMPLPAFVNSDFNNINYENILSYEIEKIIKLDKKKNFENENYIIISTKKIFNQKNGALGQLDFVAIDEAQRFFNEKSKGHDQAKKFFEAHKPAKKLLITATPFENDIIELWNLLALAHPQDFDPTIIKTLKDLFDEVKKKLIDSKIQVEEMAVHLLRSFAQYYTFKNQVVNPLTLRFEMLDEEVARDWPNLVPTRKDLFLTIPVDKEIEENLNKLTKGNLDFFSTTHSTKEKLWGNKGNVGPIVNPLVEAMKKTLEEGKNALCFVELLNSVAIIEKKVGEILGAEKVKSYTGKFNEKQREETVNWYKGVDNGKLLVLTDKAGGVGLNLWKADKVFIATMGWNPGVVAQAEARALRIGHPGEKEIVHLKFKNERNKSILFQKHQRSIEKEKNLWAKFIWSKEEDLKILFKLWGEVVLGACYHNILNNVKDSAEAKEQKRVLENKLKDCNDKITVEELSAAVTRATIKPALPTIEELTLPAPILQPIQAVQPVNAIAGVVSSEGMPVNDFHLLPIGTFEEAKKIGTLARGVSYRSSFENLLTMNQSDPQYSQKVGELLKNQVLTGNYKVCIYRCNLGKYYLNEEKGQGDPIRLYFSERRGKYCLLLRKQQ